MGMFASFTDVIHPSGETELSPCTACSGTGLAVFPINVSTGEDDFSPCPYGCLVPEDRDGYYTDYEPEVELEDILLDAWYRSKRPTEEVDPFLILSKAAKKAGIRPWTGPTLAKHAGLVASDIDLMGTVEDDLHKQGDHLLHYECTVPAYLAGTPISYEDGCLRVQYEFLGSFLVVSYSEIAVEFIRFAYSWDNTFMSADLAV